MTSHSDSASVCDAERTECPSASPGDAPTHDRRFPRQARLLSGNDYGQVFRRNRRYADRYWTILVRRSEHSDARLGLAIAKKRARRAVDRNRLKRIAREAFRNNRTALHGHELVVMNRDDAAKASAEELRQGIERLIVSITTRRHKGTTSARTRG